MHDARRVRGGEAARHVGGDPHRLRHGERAARQPLAQALAVEALHRDPGAAAPVVADVVDRDDVGMVEERGGLRLLQEAARALGIRHGLGPQQLDRHGSAEARVAGTVEHAHSALAELVGEFEASERAALQACS